MSIRPPAALAALLAATSALAQSDAGSGGAADDAAPADLDLGRQVFLEAAEPQCAVCHTLADAGSAGEIGPDLDGLAGLDVARVRAAVTHGVGVMPAYDGVLEPEGIEAVSAYVAAVAGG